MKFLRFLFSKTIVVVLLICMQVGLILTLAYKFYHNSIIIQIIGIVIGSLLLLYIINKKNNPEVKLPWVVIFLIVPFFGVALYILFAEPKVKVIQSKFIKQVFESTNKYTSQTETEKASVISAIENYGGVENYLRKNSYTNGRLFNKITYINNGEEFFDDLISELEKATDFIFMEYFVLARGKLWDKIYPILQKKTDLGVDVRVIYDHVGSLGRVGDGLKKQLIKSGIKCVKFNPFVPIVSGIYNNRDHRKITVIDGRVAYTGGINIGDEYANIVSRFGHWKDTAIKIQGPSVKDFTASFLQIFDMESGKKSDYEKFLNVETEYYTSETGYLHFYGDGPKPIYNEQVGEYNYINLINSASDHIYITTPYLIPDYNMIQTLKTASYKGVEVKIILPKIPDKKLVFAMSRSNYLELLKSGVKIYEYTPGFIHAKGMVVDEKIACVGTVNLDYRSFLHHYECGAVFSGSSAVSDMEKDFNNTLALSTEVTMQNFKLGFFTRIVTSVLKLFSPLL